MKTILKNIAVGLVTINFAVAAYAATDEARVNYNAAKERANATYKVARDRCDSLSSNPKDVCIAEAKAEEKRSIANAEAQYKNTPRAKMKSRIAVADANFAVAKEKCNAKTGNAKDVCIEEAKATHVKAKVDAKSHKEIGDIKSDAAQDKYDADYKVALEKCDSLAGASKDACVASAKSQYGK
jgi:hypothetical protein